MCRLTGIAGTFNGIEPSLMLLIQLVLFVQWQVKVSATKKFYWVKDTSFMFTQSLWHLLPPSPCPSMSQFVVPAPCRGQASPVPVGWEDGPPSRKWWQVTSWWTSQAATSLSICSSHQTDCACTGKTAVGIFHKVRNINNLESFTVRTRAGHHLTFFDISVNTIT